MNNVLVTGGAGFIGANFVRYMLNTRPGSKVVVLDALTYAGNLANLNDLSKFEAYEFIEGDINNRPLVESILSKSKVDTIVHFAAETHVDRSIHSSRQFVETNVMGTLNLLECAAKAWLKDGMGALTKVRFHHISTDEVYGSLSQTEPAFSESTAYSPNSPYAASKAASDHLVRAYGHTYGLPFTISNCSNNYGPFQYPEKLVALVILNAVEGKVLPIYGDGMQIRDWLYVEDHCKAITRILDDGEPGETYNIGGKVQITNLKLVTKICAILDAKLPDSAFRPHAALIQFVKDRPGHDRRYDMDIAKITRNLNWRPEFTLDMGLEATVSWYLENIDWVNHVQSKPDYTAWINTQYGNRREK